MTDRYDPSRDDRTRDETMNELDTEQLLEDWFHEDAPKREPAVLLPAVLARTAMTRRRPKWFTRDWWLSVLGLIDRRPPNMVISLGFVAVLTALALMAALVVAPGDEPEQLEVPPGTLVVAADGSGDFETVGDAVAAAEDGNTILIMPGEYTAAVDTSKPLTYRGAGADRSDVVIRPAPGSLQAIRVDDGDTTIEHLSVRRDEPYAGDEEPSAVSVAHAALTLRDVDLVAGEDGCGLMLEFGSDEIWGGVDYDLGSAFVSGSLFRDGQHGLCSGPYDALAVEGSTFENLDGVALAIFEGGRIADNRFSDNGVAIEGHGGAEVTGNTFQRNGTGVHLVEGHYDITGNTFQGDRDAIRLTDGAYGYVADNEIRDVGSSAIELQSSDPLVERNVIVGGHDGIAVSGDDPWLMSNTVEGMTGTAITVDAAAAPKVVGNELCGNAVDLDTPDDLDGLVAGNPICSAGDDQPATYVVAQDGSGDFVSIGDAVEAASDGDAIVVYPGTYDESIVVGKDVAIAGLGDRGDIVVEVSAPFPQPRDDASMNRLRYDDPPFAFWFVESDASLENLTLQGRSSTIIVRGGAPRLRELKLSGLGYVFRPPGQDLIPFMGLSFEGASTGSLEDSLVQDTELLVRDAADVTVEGNTFTGGAITIEDPGTDAVIRGNRLVSSDKWAIGVWTGASPTIRANTIIGARTGIDVHAIGNPVINANIMYDDDGRIDLLADADAGELPDVLTSVVIEANEVRQSDDIGINVREYATATLTENALDRNSIGISVVRPGPVSLSGNEVTGGVTGIEIVDSSPSIDGSTVERATRVGLEIRGVSSPVLTGNVLCDNAQNLRVADGASPVVGDSNQVCEDVAASPSGE